RPAAKAGGADVWTDRAGPARSPEQRAMTRVFVYEWCCGGAARGDSPRAAPLWSEGWAMLSAAMEDFRRIAGVQLRVLLDGDLRAEPTVAGTVAGWPDMAVTWGTDDEPAGFRTAA